MNANININVLDIETYRKNEYLVPYCVCLILKNKEMSFYYNKNENLLKNVIFYIINNTDKDVEIYIHNLNFDGMIIIDFLTSFKIKFEIMSIKFNLYYIKIIYLDKKITFRCSYKILPISLRKIGIIENYEKTFFPYNFVNGDNLFYIGQIPNKEY
jgi:hypothetical protein